MVLCLNIVDLLYICKVHLYMCKGEKTECKNYRGISLLNVVGKIYAEILVDRVCRVTGSLIDEEQEG